MSADATEYQRARLATADTAYVVRVERGKWAVYVIAHDGGGDYVPLWGGVERQDLLPHQRARRQDEDGGWLPAYFFECTGLELDRSLRTVNEGINLVFLEGWFMGSADECDDSRERVEADEEGNVDAGTADASPPDALDEAQTV